MTRPPSEFYGNEFIPDKANSNTLNLRIIFGVTLILYGLLASLFYCFSFFAFKLIGALDAFHIFSIGLVEALTIDMVLRKSRMALPGWRRYMLGISILAVVAGSLVLREPRHAFLIIGAAEALTCVGLFLLKI